MTTQLSPDPTGSRRPPALGAGLAAVGFAGLTICLLTAMHRRVA